MTIKIDEQALARIERKFKKLSDMRASMRDPMDEALTLLHKDLASAPVKQPGAFARYATPAQKRAYWARVRAGEINHREGVGYVRGGILSKSWTAKQTNIPGGLRGEVGTNNPYARYVQDAPPPPQQQRFHEASGWPRVDTVEEKRRPEIGRIFQRAIRRILNA